MDKLSFAEEECKNKNCLCNRDHKHFSTGHRGVFQYPKICEGATSNLCEGAISSKTSNGRALIRDAKLKLHHREKDHKTLIRAARLKLAKQKLNNIKNPAILSMVKIAC